MFLSINNSSWQWSRTLCRNTGSWGNIVPKETAPKKFKVERAPSLVLFSRTKPRRRADGHQQMWILPPAPCRFQVAHRGRSIVFTDYYSCDTKVQLQPDLMLFKGAEKIWRLTIRTLSSSCGSLHFVCRSFLHTSEPSKRESQLQLPSLRALILRERAPSLGPERPRVSTWAAGVCLTCLWFEPPQLRHLASTLEMLTFGSAPPWSPGEKKNPLWLPKLCVCV